MRLLSGDLQELFLHVNESVHATPHKIGHRMRSRPFPDAFFHPGHQDLVLFLRQVKEYLLPFNEIGHALPGYFGLNRGGGVMWVSNMLAQSMHNARILAHDQIQQNPLCSQETLQSLLRPTRY